MRVAADLGIMVAVAVGLFWLMSPAFPALNRLLITDPTWGLLSVFGLFMMGLFMALEITGIIVVNLLYRPPFQ